MVSQIYRFVPEVRQNAPVARVLQRPLSNGAWEVDGGVYISGPLPVSLPSIRPCRRPLDGAVYIHGKPSPSVPVPCVSYLCRHPHRHTEEWASLISQASLNPIKLTIKIKPHGNRVVDGHLRESLGQIQKVTHFC